MRPPLCLYVVGGPPAEVAAAYGDFTDWFGRRLDPVRWHPFDGTSGRLPRLADWAGVIVTGSPASLTAPEPWMEAAVELVRRAHDTGTPLLGVCFGHQLIGAAFGAAVVASPAGWEAGCQEIELTAAGRADPLLAGLPDRFPALLCHRDHIAPADRGPPAPGLTVLATGARTPVQAVAAGPVVRGVQFHPEFDLAITRAYLAARRDLLAADAAARGAADDHPDRLAERATECPLAATLVERFVRHWCLG
jgi:GMP synthase (glutamine-hydrolysing)